MHAAYLYDALQVYMRALNEVLVAGGDPLDGPLVVSKMLNRSFTSTHSYA